MAKRKVVHPIAPSLYEAAKKLLDSWPVIKQTNCESGGEDWAECMKARDRLYAALDNNAAEVKAMNNLLSYVRDLPNSASDHWVEYYGANSVLGSVKMNVAQYLREYDASVKPHPDEAGKDE